MKRITISREIYKNIGKNVEIVCDEFKARENVYIGDNVKIEAKKIILGNNAYIGKNTTVRALKDKMRLFVMGDQSFLDFNCQVLVPEFTIGDYSYIYNSCLLNGYKPLTIGCNCWIGQMSIVNSTDFLTIGNNVRIGVQSKLWTHVASGEFLEGCTLFGSKPLIIEDNVWVIGGVTVSMGLVLKKNSVIMADAVVTKSTLPYHTYAGVPAVDITDKLNCWKSITLKEKFNMMKSFAAEFEREYPEYKGKVYCLDLTKMNDERLLKIINTKKQENIIIIKKIRNWDNFINSRHSIYDLKSKKYLKRNYQIEIDWMKYIVGYKARFIPRN